MVLDAAEGLGVTQFKIMADDVVKGNEKLNMGFMAAIFNALPGLDKPSEERALLVTGLGLEDDEEGAREERAFRMWINSLVGAEGLELDPSLPIWRQVIRQHHLS